jgi:CheY-like chemotaxis protein
VVDDEPEVRRLLTRQLEMAGYRVIEAGDGDEALLRFLEPPRPDLVVTDTRMPHGMSGIELIRRILALAPDQVILRISGMPNDPDEPAPPHIPFLAKPFRADELLARVAALCPRLS